MDSSFSTMRRLLRTSSGRSASPRNAANRMKEARNHMASAYSCPEYPAIDARSAVIAWVAGRNGDTDEKKGGKIASGNAPPAPEICRTSKSTPRALPAFPNVAISVYIKNENTTAVSHRGAHELQGVVVLNFQEIQVTQPQQSRLGERHRPENQVAPRYPADRRIGEAVNVARSGSSSARPSATFSSVTSERMDTTMRTEPTHRARIVYMGAI